MQYFERLESERARIRSQDAWIDHASELLSLLVVLVECRVKTRAGLLLCFLLPQPSLKGVCDCTGGRWRHARCTVGGRGDGCLRRRLSLGEGIVAYIHALRMSRVRVVCLE